MIDASSATPADAADEVDLLVCGAGPGGMAAALSGALHGLNVLVCEKSQQIGGTAATSAGTLWIPGNTQSIAAGFSGDTPEAARRYMDQLIDNPDDGAANRSGEHPSGAEALAHVPERSDQVPNEQAETAYGRIRGMSPANPELSDPNEGRPGS